MCIFLFPFSCRRRHCCCLFVDNAKLKISKVYFLISNSVLCKRIKAIKKNRVSESKSDGERVSDNKREIRMEK